MSKDSHNTNDNNKGMNKYKKLTYADIVKDKIGNVNLQQQSIKK